MVQLGRYTSPRPFNLKRNLVLQSAWLDDEYNPDFVGGHENERMTH